MNKKNIYPIIFGAFILIVLYIVAVKVSNSSNMINSSAETSKKEPTIIKFYEDGSNDTSNELYTIDIYNGLISVWYADKEDVTEENLLTWYAKYCDKSASDYCLIIYTDSPIAGVYTVPGTETIYKDVVIEESLVPGSKNVTYHAVNNMDNSTMYFVDIDKHTIKEYKQ